MKKNFLLAFAAITMISGTSYAGFLVKKQPVVTVATSKEATGFTVASATGIAPVANTMESRNENVKHSVLSRIAKKLHSDAEMPKGVYILLAILGLGWLAMGINDNFTDLDWLLSLLLYILGWLPGLIYTLIKMKKYYK